MNRRIEADYGARYLLPPAVEDWIPEDHPARFIRELVDSLDLEELGFKEHVNQEGRPGYSCGLLLKVVLYAYLNSIRHLREIEKACLENMSVIWLTGNNAPDHTTIGRFITGNGEALHNVYKSVVKIANSAGLIGVVLHAVDGSKFASKASKRGVLNRHDMERLLKEMDKAAEEMDRTVEKDLKDSEEGYRLPEGMTGSEELRRKIKEVLEEMDASERNRINPDEPEARLIRAGKEFVLGYNAQIVVDEKSGLIVATDVVNDEIDKAQLVPMIEKVEENLGTAAGETVADSGYCSSKSLSLAEERNFGVIVEMTDRSGGEGEGEFHASKFTYDEVNDCMVCPLGEKLTFEYISDCRKGPRRAYRCKKFKSCERRKECTRSTKGRSIKIGEFYSALVHQRQKHAIPQKVSLLKKRKGIVENVFGSIKESMGFRRWTVGGLINVKIQWALICSAFNLKKLFRIWRNEFPSSASI